MSLITVIVPYRNAEKYIRETLSAILHQTFQDFELLCIDNGSNDSSSSIVDSVIAELWNVKNLFFPTPGKCLALNYALTQATGEWIAICDADDVWDLDKLEKQVVFSTSGVDIIGTQMRYINAAGEKLQNAPLLPVENEQIYKSLFDLKQNPICNSSVLYRKSIHTEYVGFYDPLCAVEDYDFWSRCACAKLNFFNLNGVLVSHRLHDESNFNSSKKQSYHKQLVDVKIDVYNSIEEMLLGQK